MKIRVRVFASFAEILGWRDREIEVAEGALAGDVLAELARSSPSLAGATVLLAVNRQHCDASRPLAEGDEVALFPPVSGGSSAPDAGLVVTPHPLDPMAIASLVRSPAAGAIVTFEGVVRDHGIDGPTAAITYEAYPEMALEVLRTIRAAVEAAHPGARLAMAHRTGRLEVGEPSVVVACGAPHRKEAFEACRVAMDRIKESLPVWKSEEAPDGLRHWVEGHPFAPPK